MPPSVNDRKRKQKSLLETNVKTSVDKFLDSYTGISQNANVELIHYGGDGEQ